MIGYYVHHRGHGHLHRASAIARHIGTAVTGLSSLPRPDDWASDWVVLDRDDLSAVPLDTTAGGRLHWVPLGDAGLRSRSAAVSEWLMRARPELVVVDVSVEITMLVRLHGVPVVTVAVPGDRGDPAHRLGYDASTALFGAWPAVAHSSMLAGLGPALVRRVQPVGAISRFPVAENQPVPAARTVVVLLGSGGDTVAPGWLAAARASSPGWSWTVLGGASGTWTDDPWPAIRSAGVVITHAGQNAVAEVAAARRPALVVPQERPHGEQAATAAALAGPRWPAEVVEPGTRQDWPVLLDRVARLDGRRWAGWCDGRAAVRAAHVVERCRQPAALGVRHG